MPLYADRVKGGTRLGFVCLACSILFLYSLQVLNQYQSTMQGEI